MVNLHFSLLPRWRGAAPVERAILAGDERTGVCLMALDEGLDTGPVYGCVETPIRPEETAAELRVRLADLGSGSPRRAARRRSRHVWQPVPQVGEALYAAKIDRTELELAWERPAVELERVVRVGRAWTSFRGRRLIVERAHAVDGAALQATGGPDGGEAVQPGTLVGDEVVCGEGRLQLLEVRPEGRSVQSFAAWRRGARPAPGERFGA